MQALAGKVLLVTTAWSGCGGEKRGTPVLLPCTARSCSTMENGVSDLPTNIICDTGLGGIYPGHPPLSDNTNHAVHNSTQS